MRAISILAFTIGLAVCRFGSIAPAVAAAAGLPQQQAMPQAECTATPAVPGGTQDQLTSPSCRQETTSASLVQRRPGFWIAEDANPASNGNAADPPPTVLRPGNVPAPVSAPSCTSYPLAVVVDGQPRQATIVACPQADGGWQITQYTPGLPPQVYPASAPPAAAASLDDYGSSGYYPYWGWTSAPWFFGFSPGLVGVQKFHRLQAFGRGFAHGFAPRFAAGHGSFTRMHR